jgi:hypothetical protein
MKNIFLIAWLGLGLTAAAQELRDGKWYDDNLQLVVIAEDLAREGTLTWCIEQIDRGECVENLATAFELMVYDAQGKQLVKSLWVKNQKTIALKNPQPKAHRVVMRATHPSVINTLTGTRIYQSKPLELEFVLR